MKKQHLALSLAVLFCSTQALSAQPRGEIDIPDFGGYKILKCDFHTHTVFSDGNVWPTVRVREAVLEGLDAVSITDHIEYLPHKKYVTGDHNTPYTIAAPGGKNADVLVIKGSEITRGMPPGHFNAIFLQDCNALVAPDYMDSFKAAKEQGAFIFFNHPGWWSQTPNKTVWLPEHTKLYDAGYMQGIEVVNGDWYFPEVHAWAIEKNLTLIGNSDSHSPMAYEEYYMTEGHRPMTLVLAAEKSERGIREALDARRTLVYYRDMIIGTEQWIRPLFEACLNVKEIRHGKGQTDVTLWNDSDLTFRLLKKGQNENLNYLREKTVLPHSEVSIRVRYPEQPEGAFELNFVVENLLVGPNEGLVWTIPLK